MKELKYIEKAHDYNAFDVWLLILIFSTGGSQSRVKKIIKKKIVDGLLRETLFGQCIYGNRDLVQVNVIIRVDIFHVRADSQQLFY